MEKKDEEEARKRIEEQLSEAMIRTCWKCQTKYFKEEGCNKMTCPKPTCGAKMCYLCKQPVKDYTHFYGQGGAPTATKTCPLWTDNKRLHEQEIAQAAAAAKKELAAQNPNLTLKHDPTKGIAAPQALNHAGAAPDPAAVVAPGVPREEIVRQQRYIEEMILGRGPGLAGHPLRFHPRGQRFYHGVPGIPHIHQGPLAGVPGVPVQVPGQLPGQLPGQMPPWQDGFIARMGEILRLREQNRANLRVVRQREQAAMRELQRANNLAAGQAGGFGLPQAVPEPAPFLDLVEAQGRNIQVVQQAPHHHHLLPHRHHGQPADLERARADMERRRVERRNAMVEEDRRQERLAEQQRRHQERRRRHEIREQLEQARRRAERREGAEGRERVGAGQGDVEKVGEVERVRERQQQVTNDQRERAVRSREEAVRRLRRNREEVLRRQRRERPQEGEGNPGVRGFNFQEILDLDALQEQEYLGL